MDNRTPQRQQPRSSAPQHAASSRSRSAQQGRAAARPDAARSDAARQQQAARAQRSVAPNEYSRSNASGRYASTSKKKRRRGSAVKRIVIGIVCVAVVCVGVFVAYPLISEKLSAPARPVSEVLTPENQAAVQEKLNEYIKEQRLANLGWRDADFAVDPGNVPGGSPVEGEKVVYLTIDDGPSPLTPKYLDVFDRYGVRATFFVTAHDLDSAGYIKEAYDRGHTIGLHTYSHDYASVYASDSAYFADLDAIASVVEEQIGYVPCFIRFPGGSSNGISASYSQGIMSRLVDEVQARGYQYYDWNCSVGDGSEHTADEILGYGTDCDYDTIVLLCHDSGGKQTTLDALPGIIEYYQSRGYEFRAIDRDAPPAHHGVSN